MTLVGEDTQEIDLIVDELRGSVFFSRALRYSL